MSFQKCQIRIRKSNDWTKGFEVLNKWVGGQVDLVGPEGGGVPNGLRLEFSKDKSWAGDFEGFLKDVDRDTAGIRAYLSCHWRTINL